MLGITVFRTRILFALLATLPMIVYSEPVMVGDIEINPEDFSAKLSSEKRIAKCLSCHGTNAGGDIDFGPEVRFGTPALRGMREAYVKESLLAYKNGTRQHKEMRAIATLLDEETMNFMASYILMFDVSPMKPASELAALAEKDPLFGKGQAVALQGIPNQGVPACIACHGALGEGSVVGPRLAGQNVMYIKNQFEAFKSGARQTALSAVMYPVVAGLSAPDIDAVAHYYNSLSETGQP